MSKLIHIDNYDQLKATWRHKFVTEQGFYTILDDFLAFDLSHIVSDPNLKQNEKVLKDVAFWLTLIQNNIDSTDMNRDKVKVKELYTKAY